MSHALAALRLGYLSHKFRWVQDRIWSKHSLTTPDVEPVIHGIDQCFLGLSHRMIAYERSVVLGLKKRLIACHYEASTHCGDLMLEVIKQPCESSALSRQHWRERVNQHPATGAFKKFQQQNWSAVRTIMTNVIGDDPRLCAWFETGDHLGEAIFGLLEEQMPCPFTRDQWDRLYSGVGRLAQDLQDRLQPLFPASYKSRHHLACQLQETYRALCTFAATRLETEGMARPTWDGAMISWCDQTGRIRRQQNSVIIGLLDEFERLNWSSPIPIPTDLEGDFKQAIYHFNQMGVLRLSLTGRLVSWAPPAQPEIRPSSD